MSRESLRDALRATAKELVWLPVRHDPGEQRPICLFCTRRGGSTWLMETIGAARGMLPLNQPLEILTPNLTPYQYRRLPKFDRGQVVLPEADQEQALQEYVDDLLAGRIRVNAPHRPWRSDFHWRTDRLLLKIVDAKPMMDWFDATYDVDVVYLLRHPVPQALSCLRNGWDTTTLAYTRSRRFVDEVLGDPALASYAEEVDRDGTGLERFVVNWVVENLAPLQVLADRPSWLVLSYEESVVDREQTLQTVASRLGLTDLDRMRQASERSSRSSGMSTDSTRAAIVSGDHTALVGGWQHRLAEDDVRRVQAILDRFGVTVYRSDAVMPDWSGLRDH